MGEGGGRWGLSVNDEKFGSKSVRGRRVQVQKAGMTKVDFVNLCCCNLGKITYSLKMRLLSS